MVVKPPEKRPIKNQMNLSAISKHVQVKKNKNDPIIAVCFGPINLMAKGPKTAPNASPIKLIDPTQDISFCVRYVSEVFDVNRAIFGDGQPVCIPSCPIIIKTKKN